MLHNPAHGRPSTHGGVRHGGGAALDERRGSAAGHEHLGGEPADPPTGTRQRRDADAPLHPQAHPHARGRAVLRRLRGDAVGGPPGAAATRPFARRTVGRAAPVRAGGFRQAHRTRAWPCAGGAPRAHADAAGGRCARRPHRSAHRPGHSLRPPARFELGGAAPVRLRDDVVRISGLPRGEPSHHAAGRPSLAAVAGLRAAGPRLFAAAHRAEPRIAGLSCRGAHPEQ